MSVHYLYTQLSIAYLSVLLFMSDYTSDVVFHCLLGFGFLGRRELQIAALLCGVGLVSHICFVNVLFTMTCQDMFAVLVICLVVEGAVKVGVPNFALPLSSIIMGM
ncbi:hypothetical protein K2173_022580 [Erythroxylum novogranatense]|uniref:Uncharacterized protein n=1 Tax=Erythroxylum novogranatense TaxID=1862640 RepID=A0AAV8TNF9_9ROSI|nr:hypothetical protein K2173_022580 [Erythroxylum novogranatense]